MRRLCLLFALLLIALGPRQYAPAQDGAPDPVRLPNGKLQRDEIVAEDTKRNQEDAAALLKLAQELKEELDDKGKFAVSVKTFKKLDDIEKLDKAIRGRLGRY